MPVCISHFSSFEAALKDEEYFYLRFKYVCIQAYQGKG